MVKKEIKENEEFNEEEQGGYELNHYQEWTENKSKRTNIMSKKKQRIYINWNGYFTKELEKRQTDELK